MSLPIRTTLEDILAIVNYLSPKVTGATIQEAKTVLDAKLLDGRKVTAFKYWKIITEDDQQRLTLTSIGREIEKDDTKQKTAFRKIIKSISPYNAIIERSALQHDDSVTTTECGTHWQQHFKDEIGESDKIIKDQAVAFFHILEGAQIGKIVPGRKGNPTRISFFANALQEYIQNDVKSSVSPTVDNPIGESPIENVAEDYSNENAPIVDSSKRSGKGIFIAHGKNKKPLEQLKKILDQFHIPYRVAVDEPNLGRPISGKVREIMNSCNCAILIFTADEKFSNSEGAEIWRPSENVVYELGATGFLYDNQIVILKEDNVDFPSNFRDIGYITFKHDELDAKAMEVIQELIGFGIVKIST